MACSTPEKPRYQAMVGCISARPALIDNALTITTPHWRRGASSGAYRRATIHQADALMRAWIQLMWTKCPVSSRHGSAASAAARYSRAGCQAAMACSSNSSAAPNSAVRSAGDNERTAGRRIKRMGQAVVTGG
jgi:hypothetical protein